MGEPPGMPLRTEVTDRLVLTKVLRSTGSLVTYLGKERGGTEVRVEEFLPVDLARRDRQGTVSAHPDRAEAFERARSAFENTGQALRSLRQPGLVTIDQVLNANGTTYLVSSHRRLRTVGERVTAQGAFAPDEVLRLGGTLVHIAEGIHRAGFVHSNLSPASVSVDDDGEIVVDDFGTWRSRLGDEARGLPNAFPPGYTALETYYPHEYQSGPWTDVYGIAALMYFCLTGTPPPDVLARIDYAAREPAFDPLPGLSGHGPHGLYLGLPAHTARALQAGLNALPSARPARPLDLERAFAIPAQGPAGSEAATATEPPGSASAASTRGPGAGGRTALAVGQIAALAAVVLLGAALAIGISSGSSDRPSPLPETSDPQSRLPPAPR